MKLKVSVSASDELAAKLVESDKLFEAARAEVVVCLTFSFISLTLSHVSVWDFYF